MPPSLAESRPVLEELFHLKDDLVVDEAEENGDNHPLRKEWRSRRRVMLQRKRHLLAIRLRVLGANSGAFLSY